MRALPPVGVTRKRYGPSLTKTTRQATLHKLMQPLLHICKKNWRDHAVNAKVQSANFASSELWWLEGGWVEGGRVEDGWMDG